MNVHFEASVALSGSIAPKLYVHLKKVQANRERENRVVLTGTEINFEPGSTVAYNRISGKDDYELDDFKS